MYKHTLKVYGEYLAKEQALPKNTSADGNGEVLDLRGALGGVEIVAEVTTEIVMADGKVLTLALQESEDGESYSALATLYSATLASSGGNGAVIPVGTILGRFVPASDVKECVKAVLTTDDAAAAGAVSIYPSFLPR